MSSATLATASFSNRPTQALVFEKSVLQNLYFDVWCFGPYLGRYLNKIIASNVYMLLKYDHWLPFQFKIFLIEEKAG